MALTLAIDLGTTNLKVGLINEKGGILSLASEGIVTESREPGEAEHDPEAIMQLIFQLCKKVLQDENKSDVRFIISSTYHFGLMMLDEQRKPLTGMTLLSDTRSQSTFSDFAERFSGADLYQKTGCPLISQYILPRLYYFSKEKRALLDRAKYFHDSKSFLFERLTGEWVTDISTAAATQLFNAHDLKWDREILSSVHLSSEQFPVPADGTKYQAPLKKQILESLGLSGDVQVVLGVYDGAVLGFGLSGLRENVGLVNIGTTAMLRVPGRNPVFDKNENKRIQAYALDTKVFLNGGALNNAALPLDWMKNNLFNVDLQDPLLLQLTGEPPLMALPYLTGERDSKTGPFASGVFFGVRRYHRQTDFVRSVLEGVAYSMRYLYDALKENDLSVEEIRMGGGGVNINAWPQIFADVLGVPVNIPPTKEIALVGNALLAFTAGAVFANYEEAAALMLKGGKTIEPDNSRVKVRNDHYAFYKKLREQLGPLFQEHSSLRF